MGIRMPRIIQARQILQRSLSNQNHTTATDLPKGYFPVYVGEQEKKRFVIPVSLLSQPSFQDLLRETEEEFGYDHPMGGLTIPCSEQKFFDLASRLRAC
ncbi:auxin-responsive protein SAUR21 isoform X2 [Lactuca sativa]|uniref:Uncharacterized protein n=2 Tax=Lactuca sativa TaxID=4236 RepID=A0A9R1WWE6_LACSA|nr:auxin-responsive protein SAUR21 isoform X2 [Lactuca sativa]XP_052622294.1 auxin-responsive protein SAUR21 isoform X2 [Lactuca sativa]KAJ0190146.1 hypothetical protein LSAT_V11C800440560 [Lactuca sativa]